jgi:signal transduction histidine kinase
MTTLHGSRVPAALHGVWENLRPLDPVRSIKMKLGVVVVASVIAASLMTWYGLRILVWSPRYTMPIAIVLTLVVTQVLARGMTAPLRQMTAAARAMAAGRPAPPVHTTSRDEVGELARAFTAMSQELATADAQRRELLANVGHELRTPVAALRAQLENLADGVRPADATALAEVLEQVERLGDLLSDLLDLARADAGAVPLDRRPVVVEELVTGLVRQVEAARPGPEISVDVRPAGLVADADPYRLGQVVTNLVDNAARHARSAVAVRAWADDGGGLVVEVTDDGPGIPRERWESVFERFRRGATGEIAIVGGQAGARAAATSRGPVAGPGPVAVQDGSTGLGLAIARWAVVLHGGRIAVVESDGGCRIRAEIPAAA